MGAVEEQLPILAADRLKNSVTKKDAAIEGIERGVLMFHEFAVQIQDRHESKRYCGTPIGVTSFRRGSKNARLHRNLLFLEGHR